MLALVAKTSADLQPSLPLLEGESQKAIIIPPRRVRYLSEIAETIRGYDDWVMQQSAIADRLYGIRRTIETLQNPPSQSPPKGGRSKSPSLWEGLGEG